MAMKQPHYIMPENPPLAMRQKMVLKAYFATLPMARRKGVPLSADDKLAACVLQNASDMRQRGLLKAAETPVTGAEVAAMFAADGLPGPLMASFEGEMVSSQFLAKHNAPTLAALLKKAHEIFTLNP